MSNNLIKKYLCQMSFFPYNFFKLKNIKKQKLYLDKINLEEYNYYGYKLRQNFWNWSISPEIIKYMIDKNKNLEEITFDGKKINTFCM